MTWNRVKVRASVVSVRSLVMAGGMAVVGMVAVAGCSGTGTPVGVPSVAPAPAPTKDAAPAPSPSPTAPVTTLAELCGDVQKLPQDSSIMNHGAEIATIQRLADKAGSFNVSFRANALSDVYRESSGSHDSGDIAETANDVKLLSGLCG